MGFVTMFATPITMNISNITSNSFHVVLIKGGDYPETHTFDMQKVVL